MGALEMDEVWVHVIVALAHETPEPETLIETLSIPL